jgi:hypothetical protein
MPEIEFAFLADAADTTPGQKFHVIGGGISRIGGSGFPLRHPHFALVVCLAVTTPEYGREHEVRIVLLGPDGAEITGAVGKVAASGVGDGRDAYVTFGVDLWSVTFPAPGDYSFRILVNGSERKRLPLLLSLNPAASATPDSAGDAGGPDGESGGPNDPDGPDIVRRYDA